MGRLIYSGIMSLDGYTVDEDGSFQWAAPDEEVHAFVNDLQRPVGTYLYGRRMYETMRFWETADTMPDEPPVVRDYTAIWQAADKVVYSTTLQTVTTRRTRIERSLDLDALRAMKADSDRDITIGGPTLAATVVAAGLIDEYQLFLTPIIVGGGTPFLPRDVRTGLEFVDERRFAGGVVHLRYRAGA